MTGSSSMQPGASNADRLTPRGEQILRRAQEEAAGRKHAAVTPEHLLLALLDSEPTVATWLLRELGVSRSAVRAGVDAALAGVAVSTPDERRELTPAAQRVNELAREEAAALGNRQVGPEHLLLGIMAEGKS